MLQRIGLITLLAVMTTACSLKVDRDTTGNVSPVGGVGFIKAFNIDSYAPTARENTTASVDVLSQKKDDPDAVSFQVP